MNTGVLFIFFHLFVLLKFSNSDPDTHLHVYLPQDQEQEKGANPNFGDGFKKEKGTSPNFGDGFKNAGLDYGLDYKSEAEPDYGLDYKGEAGLDNRLDYGMDYQGTDTDTCLATGEQKALTPCGGWVNLDCNGGKITIHKVLYHYLTQVFLCASNTW